MHVTIHVLSNIEINGVSLFEVYLGTFLFVDRET
jgi:hypothetical protein